MRPVEISTWNQTQQRRDARHPNGNTFDQNV